MTVGLQDRRRLGEVMCIPTPHICTYYLPRSARREEGPETRLRDGRGGRVLVVCTAGGAVGVLTLVRDVDGTSTWRWVVGLGYISSFAKGIVGSVPGSLNCGLETGCMGCVYRK